MDLAAAASNANASAANATPVVDAPADSGASVNSFDDIRNSLVSPEEHDDSVHDVREAERVEDDDLADDVAVPDAMAARGATPAQIAAALKLGKHELTAEQAARLEEMLDGGGFDLLDATWKEKDRLFESITAARQRHLDESVAMRKQAVAQMQQAKAMQEATQQLLRQMGLNPNAQAQGQQQQAQAGLPPLDPNDPINGPIAAHIQHLTSLVEKSLNHRDLANDQQIAAGFAELQKSMGPAFNEYLSKWGEQFGLKPDPITGEFNIRALDQGQAQLLQQGAMKYQTDLQTARTDQSKWFEAAISKTHFLKHSPRNQRAFWAQIAEYYDNRQPVDQNTFVKLALEIDQGIKQDNDAIGARQVELRSSAGQPLVPHGGAGVLPTAKENGIDMKNLDSLDGLRDALIARSKLTRRKG